MLSKQKKQPKGDEAAKRAAEMEEMERLRQIRQQEQNELQIKAEVEKRVQNEVFFFGKKWKTNIIKITTRVEQEIAKRMPKLEKLVTDRIRAEYSENLSEADNKKHREQVEMINDLKRKETKHVETVNRLEKVFGKIILSTFEFISLIWYAPL